MNSSDESKKERLVVGRRGQPSVIVMSIKDYIGSFASSPEWLKQIGAEAKRKGLNKLTMRQPGSHPQRFVTSCARYHRFKPLECGSFPIRRVPHLAST